MENTHLAIDELLDRSQPLLAVYTSLHFFTVLNRYGKYNWWDVKISVYRIQ